MKIKKIHVVIEKDNGDVINTIIRDADGNEVKKWLEYIIEPIKPNVFFDKSFEALYDIAMHMADTTIGEKAIEKRFDKLEEEYQELIKDFTLFKMENEYNPEFNTHKQNLIGELSDTLFVLLHIGHVLDVDAHELLHRASSKMLARVADKNYKAKN